MIKIIGLTGPIAAGKDSVAKLLRRCGACVIDADKVAHRLYSTQNPVWQELVKVFGSGILNRGGTVNRKKLGQIVFSDKTKLQKLNRIIHPYLKETIINLAESCQSSVVSCKLIVINAAVLQEIGLLDYVDEVWLVRATKAKRLQRLLRSGLSRQEATKRLNAQMSQQAYRQLADVVIKNNGTKKQLAARVAELF